MSGFTSIFHQPLKLQLSESLRPLSFHSNFFTLHFQGPATRWLSVSSTTTVATTAIVSRYGGGGGSSRRPKTNDDQALDISSIRSDRVRLIDQQQNMVSICTTTKCVYCICFTSDCIVMHKMGIKLVSPALYR
ncbi:translation initiation factor if-3 [Olea europaea subsp. europaea]|uniref:Translation initiation factor if-3 n=1 Tax=Olea europaea subsp. europaea TaxID=158383 RepID=A0A8S0VH96_OLEEU|nr:translation initiation factor if-3 [Olea europaea subsp. europaea]